MKRLVLLLLAIPACARLEEVGKAPSFTPIEGSYQHHAMYSLPIPQTLPNGGPTSDSSLWNGGGASLLGDRRASQRGDILTVVIEIDDRAEISNSSERSREGGENLGIPSLFGIPQRLDRRLPDGASMADAVKSKSSSSYAGDGSVKRKEKLIKQLKETKDYDAKIAHIALSRIDIDLDDGVKVNYEKVQTGQDGKKIEILAKI